MTYQKQTSIMNTVTAYALAGNFIMTVAIGKQLSWGDIVFVGIVWAMLYGVPLFLHGKEARFGWFCNTFHRHYTTGRTDG